LHDFMEKRACDLAVYIIENNTTIRRAAKQFGISKSTVHTVLSIGVGSIGCLSLWDCETRHRKILTEFHMSM